MSYNRRWFPTRNFTVTDNRAVNNADYEPYSIVAPGDPRLPGGGGYVIDDLWDIRPEKFGIEDNYVTAASDFGTQTNRWHGVDVNFNVRARGGLRFQGGTSTGRRITDDCEITPDNPSRRFCRVVEPFQTQIRGLGSYTIPRVDVLVSGTFQSNPGPSRAANMVVPSSVVEQTLGRPLAARGERARESHGWPSVMNTQESESSPVRHLVRRLVATGQAFPFRYPASRDNRNPVRECRNPPDSVRGSAR